MKQNKGDSYREGQREKTDTSVEQFGEIRRNHANLFHIIYCIFVLYEKYRII